MINTDNMKVERNALNSQIVNHNLQNSRLVSNLQSIIKEQRNRRQIAEQKLETYRQRSLSIENQFRKIISKYNNQVGCLVQANNDELKGLHNKILQSIDETSKQSQKTITKKYQQLINILNKKIQTLVENMQSHLFTIKKQSALDSKLVKQDIKQIHSIAKNIESQNQTLRNKCQILTRKNKLLHQEKQLLIHQLNVRKTAIAKLSRSNLSAGLAQSQTSHIQPASQSRTIPVSPKYTQRNPVKSNISEPNVIKNRPSTIMWKKKEQPSFYSSLLMTRKQQTSHQSRKQHFISPSSEQSSQNHIKACLKRERKRLGQFGKIIRILLKRMTEITSIVKQVEKKKIDSQLIQRLKLKLMSTQQLIVQHGITQDDLKSLLN